MKKFKFNYQEIYGHSWRLLIRLGPEWQIISAGSAHKKKLEKKGFIEIVTIGSGFLARITPKGMKFRDEVMIAQVECINDRLYPEDAYELRKTNGRHRFAVPLS